MKFEKLVNAVAFAVDNEFDYIVQRHFVAEEYMCEKDPAPIDFETVLDSEYEFFNNYDDAEIYRRTNLWSSIVGSHQATINVPAYLDFYGNQEQVAPEIEEMIKRKAEREKAKDSLDKQLLLSKKPKTVPSEDDLPF